MATTWYLDSSNGGTHNGTTWATAWSAFSQISGVSAGDTVYISGGPTGNTQTYIITGTYGQLINIGGTSGGRITYQIGQDAPHNGTAIFQANGTNNNLDLIVQSNYLNFLGDAGDGLQHFQISQGSQPIQGLCDLSSNHDVHISYFNCGSIKQFFNANSSSKIEIDHCTVTMNDVSAGSDRAAFGKFTDAAAFDGSLIHDNTVSYPRASAGIGADCFQFNGTGWSCYNNTLTSYSSSYAGGQHQDGIQDTGGGSFVKIYNNFILDAANYAIYLDGLNGGYSNYLIYNNICSISDSALVAGSPGGVVAGVDGGYAGANCIFDTVIIANNTVEDYGTNQAYIALNNITGHTSTFTGCIIANNISLNSGTLDITNNSTSTVVNNVAVTSGNAPTYFTTYSNLGGASNVLTLKAGATPLIGTGTTESTYFTVDFTGATRTVPWDVGPYKYGSSSTPTRLSSTVNSAGTTVTLGLDQSCTTGAGGSGGYTISASGGACTLTYSSGSGSSSYVYTTSRTINSGETITDSYTQPGNGIEATTGGADLASFSTQTVTNNSTQGGGGTGGSSTKGALSFKGKVILK